MYTATLRYHPLTATRSLHTKSCSVGSPRWLHGETNESLCESSVNLTCPRAASKAILPRGKVGGSGAWSRCASVRTAFQFSKDSSVVPRILFGKYLLLRFIIRVLLLLLLFFRFERFDGHFLSDGTSLRQRLHSTLL